MRNRLAHRHLTMNPSEPHFDELPTRVTMLDHTSVRSSAPPNPSAPPNSAGDRILGIWRLGQRVAQGRGSDLFLAQPADSRGNPRFDYVLKTVRQFDSRCNENLSTAAASANLAAGAIRESQRQITTAIQVAGVTHPNLIAILDASDSPHAPYLVMPRLDGVVMDERTRQVEQFAVPLALWWIRQVAQALAKLHTAGWVHGNVTPANVLIDAGGHATLIDLGFAARTHTPLHRTFRGTPGYASPELAAGTTAALPAMDTFALGRMLWESLAATIPSARGAIEPIAELIEKMVAADPQQRPVMCEVVQRLLALEIETLGEHIGPTIAPRSMAA